MIGRTLGLTTLLLITACEKKGAIAGAMPDAAAPAASVAPVPSASAPAAPAKGGPSYLVFASKPKAKQPFHVAFERRGNDVRALLDTGSTLAFTGKMTDDTHFSLRASKVAHGEKRSTLAGTLAAGALTATLVDGTGKKQALESTGPEALPAEISSELLGSIGKSFVRMKLTANGGKLTGIYRYAASPSDLEVAGTLKDDGSFELTESSGGKATGKIHGVFASHAALLGQWESPDGAKTAPFLAEEGSGYPVSATFDFGVTLYPHEQMITGKRCTDDLSYPQLRGGADAKAQKAVNDFLRGNNGKTTTCEGPEEADIPDYATSSSYSLDTKSGRFIGLRQDNWVYSGGAHGMYGSTCFVVDAKTMKHFTLGSKLTPAGRAKLGPMVTAELAKKQSVAKLTEVGFEKDDVEIKADTDICLGPDWIEVTFDPYEIAAYALGPQEARFPKAAVKDLFVKDEVTAAMFP